MISEALILAGGIGTGLRPIISSMPKPLVPVREKPFLQYLLRQLERGGIKEAFLCVGIEGDEIHTKFGDYFGNLHLNYVYEHDHLGTGGAVWNALPFVEGEDVFVFNGDSLFDIDLDDMATHHILKRAEITMAVNHLEAFNRYGTVKFNDQTFRINGFEEKKWKDQGYINGGIYILQKDLRDRFPFSKPFSLEKDFFTMQFNALNLFAYPSEAYFLDIGVPKDFERAQHEFKQFEY